MNRIWNRSGGSIYAALAAVFVIVAGCDALQGDGAEATEGAASEAGPCEQYAARICDETGERSQACSAVRTTMELVSTDACEAALADVDTSLKKLEGKREKCDELISKLCEELGEDTQTCQMVTEQTKQFPPERCELMLARFDDVVEDLKKREAMNKPLSPEKQAALTSGDAPSFGPEDAQVTVVEFSDFECPYCSKAADVAHKIRDEYGDKVRFVFRQYPLPMHRNARIAAQASLAAEEQGKFWEFHDQLFENQKSLDRDSLEGHAEEVGLDVDSFKEALDDERFADAVDADMDLGKKVAVRGTPTMFVNGERVTNPTSFELVSKMIEDALDG